MNDNYKVKFYENNNTQENPVLNYIEKLRAKEQQKILKHIEVLRENDGYLDEPYARHIKGKIRELRIGFSHNKHRIFYFILTGRKIILLHAFLKKTQKTPMSEIKSAENNYYDTLNNKKFYE